VAQWKRLQSLHSQMRDMHGMIMKDEEYAARTGGFGPINDGMRMMCEGYLKSHFPDNPEMVELLTPNFPVFAKRPILDCGFYDTLKKHNVSIVRGELAEADADAVILSDGTRIECDALLLSTGYNLHFGRQFDIRGAGGETLTDAFDPHPFSYEGMLITGFPNFVFMGAPYSYLVANHAVVSEQQVHYIVELLQWMVDDHLSSFDVSPEATQAFIDDVDANLAKTAWVQCGSAHGYYRDKGADGQKKVILAIPRHNSRIWHDLRSPRAEDFNVTRAGDPAKAAPREMEMLTI
jgi:cation diffusion facilitator CzcD-associated flavoprotein CzcO